MKTQAEVESMHLKAKECQRLPTNYQKLGEEPQILSLTALRRNEPCGHLDLGLLASKTLRRIFVV